MQLEKHIMIRRYLFMFYVFMSTIMALVGISTGTPYCYYLSVICAVLAYTIVIDIGRIQNSIEINKILREK